MICIQAAAGILTAAGIWYILCDIFQLPSVRSAKAISNISSKGKKKIGALEARLQLLSGKIAQKLKLNEYRKVQLETDLKTANINISPEQYTANATVKAMAVGIFSIPAFFIFKPLILLIAAIAFVVYFREIKRVTVKIKERREKIEYELPRFVNAIEKNLKHSRDVIYIFDSYKENAGEELKRELEITLADMRSGNMEIALTRLESRIGSTMMSDTVRGLISVVRGDDTAVYFASLSMKFSDYQRQLLKAQANAVPRKVRKLSMLLLACFMLIYIVVMGQTLLSSLGTMF